MGVFADEVNCPQRLAFFPLGGVICRLLVGPPEGGVISGGRDVLPPAKEMLFFSQTKSPRGGIGTVPSGFQRKGIVEQPGHGPPPRRLSAQMRGSGPPEVGPWHANLRTGSPKVDPPGLSFNCGPGQAPGGEVSGGI